MKKKLALALVFVMGLSFTACGKTTVSDSTNEAVSGGVQSTDTNEDKESSGKSDNHKVIIILNSYRMQIFIQSSNQEILIC